MTCKISHSKASKSTAFLTPREELSEVNTAVTSFIAACEHRSTACKQVTPGLHPRQHQQKQFDFIAGKLGRSRAVRSPQELPTWGRIARFQICLEGRRGAGSWKRRDVSWDKGAICCAHGCIAEAVKLWEGMWETRCWTRPKSPVSSPAHCSSVSPVTLLSQSQPRPLLGTSGSCWDSTPCPASTYTGKAMNSIRGKQTRQEMVKVTS